MLWEDLTKVALQALLKDGGADEALVGQGDVVPVMRLVVLVGVKGVVFSAGVFGCRGDRWFFQHMEDGGEQVLRMLAHDAVAIGRKFGAFGLHFRLQGGLCFGGGLCQLLLQAVHGGTQFEGFPLIFNKEIIGRGTGESNGAHRISGIRFHGEPLFAVDHALYPPVLFGISDHVDATHQPFFSSEYGMALLINSGRIHEVLLLTVMMGQVEIPLFEGPDGGLDLISGRLCAGGDGGDRQAR